MSYRLFTLFAQYGDFFEGRLPNNDWLDDDPTDNEREVTITGIKTEPGHFKIEVVPPWYAPPVLKTYQIGTAERKTDNIIKCEIVWPHAKISNIERPDKSFQAMLVQVARKCWAFYVE